MTLRNWSSGIAPNGLLTVLARFSGVRSADIALRSALNVASWVVTGECTQSGDRSPPISPVVASDDTIFKPPTRCPTTSFAFHFSHGDCASH